MTSYLLQRIQEAIFNIINLQEIPDLSIDDYTSLCEIEELLKDLLEEMLS